jgi:hypothetical protein
MVSGHFSLEWGYLRCNYAPPLEAVTLYDYFQGGASTPLGSMGLNINTSGFAILTVSYMKMEGEVG